jgi:zinc protease
VDKETRLVFEDRVEIPRLYIAWPTVGETNDDRFALAVLDAITAGPRTSRLTKALVYDQQSAAAVGTSQDSYEDAEGDSRSAKARPLLANWRPQPMQFSKD